MEVGVKRDLGDFARTLVPVPEKRFGILLEMVFRMSCGESTS